MTDDIVYRLRNGRGGISLLSEAADEIERLRIDRNRWLNVAAQFAEALWVDHTGQVQIDTGRIATAWDSYRNTQNA